jgi:hypothetical protein
VQGVLSWYRIQLFFKLFQLNHIAELVQNFCTQSRVHVLQTLTTFSLFLDVAGLLLHSSSTDS